MVLSALAHSDSLRTITHLRCSFNSSWFEDNESNVEILSEAIGARRIKPMNELKYLNLAGSGFSTEGCDKVVSAIV